MSNLRAPMWAALALPMLLAVAMVCAAATPVTVRDVRLWAGPENTRVVLELSSDATHNLISLENPDRVVIDIVGGKLAASAMPAGEGVVKQIRSGVREDGSLRVVLDLNKQVQAKSFIIDPADNYGHRLVIDLTPSGKTVTPVAAAHAPSGTRDLVIAVDAGHGGEDPGAVGRAGTREKDVVLAIARALADRINREEGMRAILIRDGDYFVSLRGRILKARQQQADLFVSVHADAVRDRDVAGSSVYILSPSGASNEAARWLAERENASDLIGGVSLEDKGNVLASVLLDLSQMASLTASMNAAEQVLEELHRVGTVRKPKIQQAGFVVLKSPDIPSMLVETAYISNPKEEKRLRDPAHQRKLADAICEGIRGYFSENPPPGTRFAASRSTGGVRRIAD
jgi:N-acetylmuramoyl-L-alanine amidase